MHKTHVRNLVGCLATLTLVIQLSTLSPAFAQTTPKLADEEVPALFLGLLAGQPGQSSALIELIDANWHPGMVPMVLETYRFTRDMKISKALFDVMEKHTGQTFRFNHDAWLQWLWKQPENRHPAYASFKSLLYRNIDPKFAEYFDEARSTTVRLDEIRWGGVKQDGIPPLRYPKMIAASEATYLGDDDVVFGVKYGGDARAYPKRILAWHEMFVDTIDGVEYAGVYCTLCGAVILYKTHLDGVRHGLGTSGFLYRSNKVMYDADTQSLWSTTKGVPFVGPLVGKDIALERSFVVTSTWGEWRRRHPQSQVLSLDTGHNRDYDEGVAYKSYFSSDELMFDVPGEDARLANKAEILALQFPDAPDDTMAISADFLAGRPVYATTLGKHSLVVLTDSSGANRVYEIADVEFATYDGDVTVTDSTGGVWRLSEANLKGPDGAEFSRVPAHRAFWFGWRAAHPNTNLVK